MIALYFAICLIGSSQRQSKLSLLISAGVLNLLLSACYLTILWYQLPNFLASLLWLVSSLVLTYLIFKNPIWTMLFFLYPLLVVLQHLKSTATALLPWLLDFFSLSIICGILLIFAHYLQQKLSSQQSFILLQSTVFLILSISLNQVTIY